MGDNIVLPDKVNDMEEALLLFLLRLKSVYCMVLLQFALFYIHFQRRVLKAERHCKI